MAPCDIKMMASLVINSIRSALNALESSKEDIDRETKCQLKILELFVLCARKLGNDAQLRFYDDQLCTLASLLQRIHDKLPRITPPYNVKNIENLSCALCNFSCALFNFIKEIKGGWYNTWLVSLPQPTSFDELNDIIDSLLDILHPRFCGSTSRLQRPIQALIKKMTFLRNFIRFATLRSIESPQLLAHIQAVAVDAAHTFFMYIFPSDDVRPNALAPLQMIKMVDPQVDETFTQALTSAKLSTQLLSPMIMKDFIDSLLWNLWERLHLDTPIVISTNSELRLVFEFLRLLINVLKEQPNKFDKRIGELTRVVICDAGILIFSLYQRDMEIDVPDSGLLQRINRITQIVKGKDFSIPDLLQRITRVTQIVKGKDFSIPELLQGISRVTQIVKGKDFSIPDLLEIGQGLSDINMMASLALYSIRSTLNDMERSEHIWKHIDGGIRTKWKLKDLELFVVCARKLGNDAQMRFYDGQVRTLSSLFQRIHDALLRIPPPYNWEVLEKVEGTIANFKEEIGGWYNNTLLVSLPQPTFDDVTTFIDSLLEHLNGLIFDIGSLLRGPSREPIEALIEKIRFLRNFIRFATLRTVEPPQSLDKLLAHIQAVAVDAAHTCFMYYAGDEDEKPNIPVLLGRIKMVNHQVDETFIQALTSAKLSTHIFSPIPDKDHDPWVIMKDFIDSLLWNLWERLHMDTPIVISTNSELQLVYEFLRLLRSMLKEQPNKFDQGVGEVTRFVICDAGILILSLYQREMEIDVPASGLVQRISCVWQIVECKDLSISIPDLLQRISRIRQRVKGKDLSIPDLLQSIHRSREQVGGNDLPKTNDLGFIDFVLENLLRMTSSKKCYGFLSQFRMIHDELSSLRCSLGEIEGVRNEQKELEALWNDSVKVVYRIEFLIDDLVFGDFQGSSSTSFDFTVDDILIDDLALGDFQGSSSTQWRSHVDESPGGRPPQPRANAVVLIPIAASGDIVSPQKITFFPSFSIWPPPPPPRPRNPASASASTSFLPAVEDILSEVKSINSKIHPAPDIEVKKLSMTSNPRFTLPLTSQNSAPVADDIVSFDDDIASIIDRLTRGSKQLKVVAIVGMPGMGKTTLATKVFKHPSVTYHFHALLECCVSQLFHKKKLLLELLSLVDPDTNGNIEKSEHELTEKLWRHLRRKRYLIFLDDLWDIKAWDSLKASFPDDSCGSRILMTSRHRAAVLPDDGPHSLRLLTVEQSWELLQKKLPPINERSLELDELGKQIAANCKGLPLTVVIVAGLLANTEPEGWKIFLESISSVSGADHCMGTLELSYKHLPGHLKQCFLYFGLFPEDHEVSIKRLIRLWIAEGFVRKNESKKTIEDVGRDYMMDLVGRSLVMVSKERSRGGVKACRIHDLLHDFCRTKGKEENFLQVLEGYDEFISFKVPGYMRRIGVHSEKKHFKNLRELSPRLHSLLFFAYDQGICEDTDMSFIIPRYRRLRVLDISQYQFRSWIGEIELVVQLKYLSVAGYIVNIPSSMGSLTNLETFILRSYHEDGVSMPDTFWNLQKLRHVDIKDGFRLAVENLEIFPELRELQSCSTVILRHGENIERLVRKFPDIRKLRCHLERVSNEILMPDSLRQLESLALKTHLGCGFAFDDIPGKLRKLSLWGFKLHQSEVSKIGKLPNLEVLKFDYVVFPENKWDMVEGEFKKLRFLTLTRSKIVRWTASDDSDDQFPCLEKLVLGWCDDLEEIPCCFESFDTLKMAEVYKCSDTVNDFFKRIRDEQMMELGNSFLLKLQFHEEEDEMRMSKLGW